MEVQMFTLVNKTSPHLCSTGPVERSQPLVVLVVHPRPSHSDQSLHNGGVSSEGGRVQRRSFVTVDIRDALAVALKDLTDIIFVPIKDGTYQQWLQGQQLKYHISCGILS